jgi:hypothetical protein
VTLTCEMVPHWPDRSYDVNCQGGGRQDTHMSTFAGRGANRFTPAARRAAREARQARANERAASLAAIVSQLRAAGITSLNGIAEALNARRVLTPAGSDRWYAIQVSRLLRRLGGKASD